MYGKRTERKQQGQVYSAGQLSRKLDCWQYHYSNGHNDQEHLPVATCISRPEMVHVLVLEETQDHESTHFHYQADTAKPLPSLLSARLCGANG